VVDEKTFQATIEKNLNNQKILVPKINLSPKLNCWINGGDQIIIDQKIEIFWG
jgi:hypothetical protein